MRYHVSMTPDEMDRERRRLARNLPPPHEVLKASLFERSRSCGRPTCHCADADDPGHPTTYVSLSLPGGKSSQVSLPRSLVPVAETWTRNYERWLEAIERISALNHELLRGRWVEPPPDKGGRRR
jgi:hypothetical protein